MGRPSLKTPELVKAICERLSTGEPLVWICRDDGMPSVATVTSWERGDMEVSSAIAHAREIGGDAIAAETLAIIDTTPDRVATELGDKADPAHVSWLKNRADHRLKLLAKWHPKRYGDRVALTGDAENPIQTRHTSVIDVTALSTAALQEIANLATPDNR